MEAIDSHEFAEWQAFDRLVPVDMEARLLAMLLTLSANVNRDPKQKPTPYTVDDFLPDPNAPTRQERETHFAGVMAAFAEDRKMRLGH